jgi:exo-beta-1,3-glucanase (GH17 family)
MIYAIGVFIPVVAKCIAAAFPGSPNSWRGKLPANIQKWYRWLRRHARSYIVPHTLPLLVSCCPTLLFAAMHGIAFSPFGPGQAPDRGFVVSPDQIRQRLQVIAPHTAWVRVYGGNSGLDVVPKIARDVGLKTAAGAWLGRNRIANDREIDLLSAACRSGYVDIAILGSEVLLRGDLSVRDLLGYLDMFRRANPGVKVGYADVYDRMLANPEVAIASDVVLVHIYPFWGGVPIEGAVPWLQEKFDRVREAFPRKLVIIAETGWPDGGNAVGQAVPSPQNQERYLRDFLKWASSSGTQYFVFSAFDETWKAAHEGPQGAHWGLWSESAMAKTHLRTLLDHYRKRVPIPFK